MSKITDLFIFVTLNWAPEVRMAVPRLFTFWAEYNSLVMVINMNGLLNVYLSPGQYNTSRPETEKNVSLPWIVQPETQVL